MNEKLTRQERRALYDASRDGREGWGLFLPKTTAKLAERGYFERAQHRVYGEQWRLTDRGRKIAAGITRQDI